MKTIIVTMSFIMFGLSTAFADGTPAVPDKVQKALNKEFPGCESVSWSRVEDYRQATFVFHENIVIAYFNEGGDLLGSARDITTGQVPLSVMRSFDKHLAHFDFLEIMEITNGDGTSYWMTLEKNYKRYQVKADGNGEIESIYLVKQKS